MVQGPLSHRCIHCRIRFDLCVCAQSPRLALPTRVLVLMHAKEFRRGSNSGHLARLALTNASVVQWGRPQERLTLDDLSSPAERAPLMLFPAQGAEPLTPELAATLARPVTLIVPDGNWGQASQMMKRMPGMARARRVALDGPTLNVMRMRRNVQEDRMSTFEALAQAVGALEGEAAGEALLKFYQLVLTRQMQLRGKLRMTVDGTPN